MLLIGLAAILALFTALWVASLALRNSSIVDIWWGPGILIIGVAYYLTSNGDPVRARLMLALVAVWAVRLALHIWSRNAGAEDHRYAAMREERDDTWWWYSYIKVFLPQAAIAWIVAAPLYFAIVSLGPTGLTVIDWLGIIVFAVGFLIEAVGDEQLRRFRNQPRAYQRVLDTGLWRYSRHPNYLGEAVLWWGLGLIAVATGGVVGLIGPLVITILLIYVSGVPLLEASMLESKPGYADYIARTPAFMPTPSKAATDRLQAQVTALVHRLRNRDEPVATKPRRPTKRR